MTVADLIEKLKELPQGAVAHCFTEAGYSEVSQAFIDDEDGYHVLIQ